MKTSVSPLLRLALRLDAAASAVIGVALSAFAAPLAGLFALPQPLLLGAGLFCVGYAAVIATMSTRDRLPRWSVWTVVIGNAVWATECLVLAFGDTFAPSTTGVAFLLGQAMAVYAFAELQYVGLRRGVDVRMAAA